MAGSGVDLEDVSGGDGVPAAAEFAGWVTAALTAARRQGDVAIRVVGEAESAALNRQYRGKSGATNVLSFPAGLPAGVPLEILGDLVICAPVVALEAEAQGKPAIAHWAHLTVHGCLHLAGFEHETDAQAAVMEPLETRILAELGYPDPYVPR